MDPNLVKQLAISLGLGLLVGLQRESTAPHVAGIRTFALITVLGTVAVQFANPLGGWLVSAGLLSVAALIGVRHFTKSAGGEKNPGLTTSVAALVMYLVGVAIGLDQLVLGILLGGSVAVLLQWKESLHAFVDRIGRVDIRAITQFVLIALVILPILPDRAYGPYNVLNPFEIWLMVVLICGISLASYTAYKFLGARTGTILGGVLGGLISSTATTVSYARHARRSPGSATVAALVIMIASTVVFGRVLVEIAVVGPEFLPQLAGPLLAMMVLMAAICGVMVVLGRGEVEPLPLDENPSELKAAMAFGLLYALVLFAAAAARETLGDRGLYLVAGLSGLTDMDAITLSTTQMIRKEHLAPDTGWRMILVGAMSNLVFKCGVVAVLGHRALLTRIATAFAIAILGGAALIAFWPA
jgi:uncharacterized membrane protein (DUF4010 family)